MERVVKFKPERLCAPLFFLCLLFTAAVPARPQGSVPGTITAFDAPGADQAGTSLLPGGAGANVNDPGVIPGVYAEAKGVFHGFVLTPATTTARVTPRTLTFGNQVVGTPSVYQPVTLSNTGTTTFTITSLTASGDFLQTNTCAGSVADRTSCTINVTFTPTAKGIRKGAITILDNATGSPQVVHLTGVGTVVKLSVEALSFEAQPVRTASNPQVVTLTNIGNTPLRITGIRIAPLKEVWGSEIGSNAGWGRRAGEFTETNDCGASVAPNASCTISVTFTPREARSVAERLTISDDGGGTPQRVSLWGVGLR